MSFFTVSNQDPKSMTPAELAREADELKLEMVKIETQIAEKAAWRVVDDRNDIEAAGWLAKSRHFRRMLLVRYMVIRPLVRANNRNTK
jgi:hypothetical protein